jgi:hypothetical protein
LKKIKLIQNKQRRISLNHLFHHVKLTKITRSTGEWKMIIFQNKF